MGKIILIFVFMQISTVLIAAEIKPFTTDGCSVFPDGTSDHQSLWMNCCIRHDLAYWKGGTYKERVKADNDLKKCVENTGEKEISELMLAGVQIGGSPYFPTPYRWGYGWSYPGGYKTLTAEERSEIKNKLEMFEVMIRHISDQLKKQ